MEINVKRISPEKIVFQEDPEWYKTSCLQPFEGHPDGCPNYNTTWSCPPNTPSLEESRELLNKHDYHYIIYMEINASSSKTQTQLEYSFITNQLDMFIDDIKKKYPETTIFKSAKCRYCEGNGFGDCTCPGNPCRFPDEMWYAPESWGTNIFETMRNIGINLEKDIKTTVRRVGMVFSNQEIDFDDFESEYPINRN